MRTAAAARRAAGLAAAAAAAGAAAAVLLRRRSERAPEASPAPAGAPPEAPDRGPATAEPAEPGSVEEVAGALSMNEASFEQLRGLGLSITQAKRFLAARERRGGFDSLDDLDEVAGLSRDLKELLRERLLV